MNKPTVTIDIDRIVLTDLEVTPDRAERIRGLVEVGLQHLLTRGGTVDGLAGGEIRRLTVSTMSVAEPRNDSRLASGLAEGIAQALRGLRGGWKHARVWAKTNPKQPFDHRRKT